MTSFDLLAIFGQVLPDPPSVETAEAKQLAETMKVVFWVLVSLLSILTSAGVALLAWFKAIVPGVRALAEWYRKERAKDQARKHAFALREQERSEANLAEETFKAATGTQKALQTTLDATAAHYVILFRTHNGDGIPKPTTPIKSTATLEAKKPSLDSVQEAWNAEPVDSVFLEILSSSFDKSSQATLIDAATLADCPLKDRLHEWGIAAALLTYIDPIDHFPTFLLSGYSSLMKATTSSARVVNARECGRIRGLAKNVSSKRSRLEAVTAEVLKTFEMSEVDEQADG